MPLAQQRRRRSIGFQAAPLPAGTRLPAEDQGGMPQLGPGAEIPFVYLAIQHHAATHAGPQRDHHGAFGAFGGAGDHFAQSGAVGIIGKPHRHAQLLLQLLAQRDVFPAQVVGVDHHPLPGQTVARRADPYADAFLQGDSGFFYCLFDTAGDIVDHIVQHPLRSCFYRRPCYDLHIAVYHADRHIGTAQVDSYTIFHFYTLLVGFPAPVYRIWRQKKRKSCHSFFRFA